MKPYYEHAGITIYHGDCREVLPELESESASIVSDPPYGMDLQPQRKTTKAITGDVRRDAKALWWGAMPELHRIAQENSKLLLFGRWSEEWAKQVLEEWFEVKGCIIWAKNNFGIGFYLRPQW